ncbi:CocE/NonD family hydrolase [Nonomuraea sp. NPDC050394]|uniref:CocE/NonD family hydrolase n=1 Tax=Nonomuraea sp. NPDC050394 TaxID=3364363 RepID=UPI0037A9F3EB
MKAPITIVRDAEMPMRDGVVLRGDVWTPDDGRRRPAVLIRTPYGRTGTNNDFLRPLECVQGDYACVVQDTRGRAGSDGEWTIFMAEQEARDTHDSVEWAAAQPWCDGNVVMAGASYLGIVQLLGAAERPPHLRAIAPGMTSSAELDRAAGGVMRVNEVMAWLAFMAMDWLERERAAGRPADPGAAYELWELATDPAAALRTLPLKDLPQFAAVPGFPLDVGKMLAYGTPGITESFAYEAVEVPALSVTGWFDNHCDSTIESFLRLRAIHGDRHRLIVGPWSHDGRLGYCQGEVSFSARGDATVLGLSAQHLAFFDEHVRGTPSAAPAVRYFLMGADEWREADRWPPPGELRTLYLGDDGRLGTRPPADEHPDHYAYDPDDPVPTRGGRVVNLGRLVPGPLDRSRLEERPDVLCYTSPVLDEPLDVVGQVAVRLFAASSARDTDFAAKLVDVFPDGRALAAAGGVQRARHRHGPDAEQLLEPGTVEEYTIGLGHTAWRFPAGHRVRLEITSSDFPAYDRNMNTGEPVGTDAAGVVAHQTVHHSVLYPSRLELPVLSEGLDPAP